MFAKDKHYECPFLNALEETDLLLALYKFTELNLYIM